MKKSIIVFALMFSSLLPLLWSGSAFATPITLEFICVSPSSPMNYNYGGIGTITARADDYVFVIHGDRFDIYFIRMGTTPSQPSTYDFLPILAGSEFLEATWTNINPASDVTKSNSINVGIDTAFDIFDMNSKSLMAATKVF